MKGVLAVTVSGKALLFIENDPAAREEILGHFAGSNTVMLADCIQRAEECLKLFTFDMIVADADFPDGSPFLLYERLRDLPPLIVYTFHKDDDTIIDWLRLGAEDYLIRPADIRLLEAKISLRLPKNSSKSFSGLTLNASNQQASYHGESLPLTSSEFKILRFLVENRGQFFSSDEIYERIWQAKALNTVTIRKHISSLRRKLLSVTAGKDLILTDFGKGYAFINEAE